jgi:hypothetical protein
MPSFLENLRLRNIFGTPPLVSDTSGPGGQFDMFPQRPSPWENVQMGPQMDFGQPPPQEAVPPSTNFDITRGMSELYSPETAASERFNQMIGQQPRMEDYKPSVLRRIGSALTAFGPGGMEAGMEFLHRPFTEKMTDWRAGIGPAQQAANLERQSNINERQLAYQTISTQLRAEADAERAKHNERNAAIRQQRADVYEFKARNPNMRFDFSGPTVKIADPLSGQVSDTGIATGSLSDADKLMLQQEQAMERIGETGRQQRMTEGIRQTGREELQGMRGWTIGTIPDPNNPNQSIGVRIHEPTGEVQPIQFGGQQVGPVTRPTSGARGAESPAQLKVRQFNAARQLSSTRPDLAKFIRIGSGNNFTIIQPGRFSGPTPEQFAEITEAIFQGGSPTQAPTMGAQSPQAGGQPQVMTKTQTNSRTGEKRTLVSNDGGRTWQVQGATTASR